MEHIWGVSTQALINIEHSNERLLLELVQAKYLFVTVGKNNLLAVNARDFN
jgi:hypothetical protein